MTSMMRTERSRRNFADEANRYDAKRERLVRCARSLAEQGDAAKVSVTDVTSEMGITRGLFYYYFGGKEELGEAIIQTYVDDLLASMTPSCESYDTREEAIKVIVDEIHRWLYEEDGSRKPIWHVSAELGLDGMLFNQTADAIASLLIEKGLLIKYGKFTDEILFEHARFVATGILGESRLRPELQTDMLCEAACAALRYRKRRAPGTDADGEA